MSALTNKQNLPESIVRAVAQSGYKGNPNALSVTTLLSPAYMRKLEREHPQEQTEDAADRIWSMVGQIGHSIAERAAEFNSLSEERLNHEFQGVTISGQVDLYDAQGMVTDFKFTTVWSRDGKPEWEAQLNVYGWLIRKAGFPVKSLQIVAVFRDFQMSKAGQGDYPTSGVKCIPVPLWDDAKVEALLLERIKEHTSPTPTPCTDEERWASTSVYAVMKEGRKTAVKLHDTFESAAGHMLDLGSGHSVVERPKEYKRCQSYCRVSTICPLYSQEIKP